MAIFQPQADGGRESVAEFEGLDEVFAALEALDAADACPRGGNDSPRFDPAAERDAAKPPDGSGE